MGREKPASAHRGALQDNFFVILNDGMAFAAQAAKNIPQGANSISSVLEFFQTNLPTFKQKLAAEPNTPSQSFFDTATPEVLEALARALAKRSFLSVSIRALNLDSLEPSKKNEAIKKYIVDAVSQISSAQNWPLYSTLERISIQLDSEQRVSDTSRVVGETLPKLHDCGYTEDQTLEQFFAAFTPDDREGLARDLKRFAFTDVRAPVLESESTLTPSEKNAAIQTYIIDTVRAMAEKYQWPLSAIIAAILATTQGSHSYTTRGKTYKFQYPLHFTFPLLTGHLLYHPYSINPSAHATFEFEKIDAQTLRLKYHCEYKNRTLNNTSFENPTRIIEIDGSFLMRPQQNGIDCSVENIRILGDLRYASDANPQCWQGKSNSDGNCLFVGLKKYGIDKVGAKTQDTLGSALRQNISIALLDTNLGILYIRNNNRENCREQFAIPAAQRDQIIPILRALLAHNALQQWQGPEDRITPFITKLETQVPELIQTLSQAHGPCRNLQAFLYAYGQLLIPEIIAQQPFPQAAKNFILDAMWLSAQPWTVIDAFTVRGQNPNASIITAVYESLNQQNITHQQLVKICADRHPFWNGFKKALAITAYGLAALLMVGGLVALTIFTWGAPLVLAPLLMAKIAVAVLSIKAVFISISAGFCAICAALAGWFGYKAKKSKQKILNSIELAKIASAPKPVEPAVGGVGGVGGDSPYGRMPAPAGPPGPVSSSAPAAPAAPAAAPAAAGPSGTPNTAAPASPPGATPPPSGHP